MLFSIVDNIKIHLRRSKILNLTFFDPPYFGQPQPVPACPCRAETEPVRVGFAPMEVPPVPLPGSVSSVRLRQIMRFSLDGSRIRANICLCRRTAVAGGERAGLSQHHRCGRAERQQQRLDTQARLVVRPHSSPPDPETRSSGNRSAVKLSS